MTQLKINVGGTKEVSVTGLDDITGQRIIPVSYIIYRDGSIIRVINGTTGAIDYSGTDASTVINNAINALKNGGKIFIRNGTYTISTSIIPKSQIIIEGEGENTILKLADNTNVDVIKRARLAVARWSYFILRNFAVDGNKDNNLTAGNGIVLESLWRCLIENIHIRNCRENGLKFNSDNGNKNSLEVTTRFLYIQSCEGSGMYVGWTYDSSFWDIYIQDCGTYGIVDYAGANYYYHCWCYNNTQHGIYMAADSVGKSTLIDCIGDTNKRHGIHLKGSQNRLIGCKAFSSSQEASNSYSGLYLNNSSNNLIIGGKFVDSQGNPTQKYGVEEAGTSDYNYIISNFLTGNVTGQIKILGSNSVVKINNGYKTENNILSGTFTIDSTGVKAVTITHGLDITPNVQDCYLTVIQDTAVDDWAYNLLKVVSTNAKYVTVKINISTASTTVGAAAKLALRVGNP